MAAVRALFAGASQGRFYLRHRRVFVSRHHARRRHADHRDGGDERLPQGIAGQDSRPQRTSSGAAAGIAADRLEGRRRADQSGRGHSPRGTGGRWPGAGIVAVQCLRGFRARHSRRRSQPPHLDRQERQTRHARRLRRRAGRRHRPAARRSIVAACRRQHHAGGAARRRDADGHHAAHQTLQGGRGVRDRHVGL